ncbi:MAG: S-layer homology domain-containing protein [Oscillospiraceae bacterium]|jgi:hypothetical protein|nr:S-layer homology domain-containing protein [Oscillospiraceae bacterium]
MLKRIITALICLAMALAVALPASSADSLVPRSFIDTYKQEIHSTLTSERDGALVRFTERLEQEYGLPPVLEIGQIQYVAPTILTGEIFTTYTVAPLSTWLETSGSACMSFSRGEVLDLSTGESIKTGTVLLSNHKYFTAENTSAEIRVYSDAAALFDGIIRTDTADEFPPEYHFIDLPPSHWATSQIADLLALGIVASEGTGGYYFSPAKLVTRAELVTVFANYENIDPALYTDTPFKDVDPESWYAPYCDWAYETGISVGYEGNFSPNTLLTREELAQFFKNYALYRNAALILTADFVQFDDTLTASDWAREAINWSGAAGLVVGQTSGVHKFAPKATATRAEMSSIMLRYVRAEKNSVPPSDVLPDPIPEPSPQVEPDAETAESASPSEPAIASESASPTSEVS